MILLILISTLSAVFAQPGVRTRRGIRLLSDNAAEEYLLNAQRPEYEISANSLTPEELSAGISYTGNSDFSTLNLDGSYTLNKNLLLGAGLDLFNSQYNLRDVKKSGIGDGYVSLSYTYQKTEDLIYSGGIMAKIPIATKKNDLGTGKPDIHFGLANYFNTGSISFQSSVTLGLLSKQDFPNAADSTATPQIQRAIDSLKSAYDYNIEPAITFNFSPEIDLNENVALYCGLSFTRNMRLNYNSSVAYFGLNVTPANAISFTAGYTAGISNYKGNYFNLGFSYIK